VHRFLDVGSIDGLNNIRGKVAPCFLLDHHGEKAPSEENSRSFGSLTARKTAARAVNWSLVRLLLVLAPNRAAAARSAESACLPSMGSLLVGTLLGVSTLVTRAPPCRSQLKRELLLL
jgi:hypothetical protein